MSVILLTTVVFYLQIGVGANGVHRTACGYAVAAPPTERTDSSRQLQGLRAAMTRAEVAAYIVPTSDEHMNEYVHKHSQRLRWLSGFSGSSGVAVVTHDSAMLWTDSRFLDQADQELDCQWTLMADGPNSPHAVEWLWKTVRPTKKVGADPKLLLYTQWAKWQKELQLKSQIKLVETENLVDTLWTEANGRPPKPRQNVMVQKLENAGRIWFNKVAELRQVMKERGAEGLLLTALDEIAWVLNIRGRDLPHVPVVTAYLFITPGYVRLYVDRNKFTPQVSQHLKTDGCYGKFCVTLRDYDDIWSDLRTEAQRNITIWFSNHERLGASKKIVDQVNRPAHRHLEASPVISMKSVKNEAERTAMHRAHVLDGVAMCDFLAHMETVVLDGAQRNESKVAFEVDHFRSEQKGFWMTSFPTHAGFGRNGALPHYTPRTASALPIWQNSTLVIDSGGQYENGTTDVARTLHFGVPTRAHIDAYTRVLQGLIEISRATVPASLSAHAMDPLMRHAVWSAGHNYPHSSGHGIGAALSVHEEPLSITYNGDSSPLQQGNFFTADVYGRVLPEPGYYREGDFGVRLENVLEVVKHSTGNSSAAFLEFRTATLVPFDMKLVDIEMLSPEQRHWLNEYNAMIQQEVGEELKRQMRMKGFHWMMNHTRYVPEHCCPRNFDMSGAMAPAMAPTALATLVSLIVLQLHP